MSFLNWFLTSPLDAVIFDCDGTLSTIEGINELANLYHVGHIVQRLTEDAMGKQGMSEELYEKRLFLIKPQKKDVAAIGAAYIEHRIPSIENSIEIFQRLNKTIYIISAGLKPAVIPFGQFLKIPSDHIFAVDIHFNSRGEYLDFDHHSPMIQKNGKRIIVNQLQSKHHRMAYIGDGLNDYEVYNQVTRFVGFGGAFYRESIEKNCEFYIKTCDLTPLIPLLLTQQEKLLLSSQEIKVYEQGMNAIRQKQVKIS